MSVTDREKLEAASGRTEARRLGVLAHGDLVLARIVAANPSAPHGLLARLARDRDALACERLFANPATPWLARRLADAEPRVRAAAVRALEPSRGRQRPGSRTTRTSVSAWRSARMRAHP